MIVWVGIDGIDANADADQMLMKLKWEMMLLRATLPDLLGIYDFARYVQYKIEFFWEGEVVFFFSLLPFEVKR